MTQPLNPTPSSLMPRQIGFSSYLWQGSLTLLLTNLISMATPVAAEVIDPALDTVSSFSSNPETISFEEIRLEMPTVNIPEEEGAIAGVDPMQTVSEAPDLESVSTSARDLLLPPDTTEVTDRETHLAQPLMSSAVENDESVSVENEPIAQTNNESTKASSDQSDLAKKSQNPVAKLISVPFQNNTNFGVGEFDRTSNIMNIQPVIPTPLNDNLALITRVIVPVAYQPELTAGFGNDFGLGDIAYQGYLLPEPIELSFGQFTWGAGPVLLAPTATATSLGTGKWGAGAGVAGVITSGPIVATLLVNNVWSFAGDSDRPDFSLMTLQPGGNYNLDDGWYINLGTGNGITANWLAEDEKWTVPIGGGFGRVFSIGSQPVNMSLRGDWNVIKPEGVADCDLDAFCDFAIP